VRYLVVIVLAAAPFIANGPRAVAQDGPWSRVYSQSDRTIYDIDMFDETGLALASGAILRTSDGGSTWTEPQPIYAQTYGDVDFADVEHAWAATASGIYYTQDGGLSWERQTRRRMQSVSAINDREAWASDLGGTSLLHTRDGGTTWAEAAIEGYEAFFLVEFADASNGWTVAVEAPCSPESCDTAGAVLLRTRNGGASWQQVARPGDFMPERMQWLDEDHGYAAGIVSISTDEGEFRLFRTNDGGDHWQLVESAPAGAYELRFQTVDEGWISGSLCNPLGCSTVPWHTADGGQTWEAITEPFGGIMTFDVSPSAIVASTPQLESDAAIQRYDFVAATWQAASTATAQQLTSISFANSSRGYALARGLLVTDDGGSTWTPREAPTFFQALDATQDAVWAVGACFTSLGCQPAVYRSTDGGHTWTPHTTPFANPQHIRALDDRTAWAWSAAVGLWRTDDGGVTCTQLEFLRDLPFLRATALQYEFIDARHGWTLSCAAADCGFTFRATSDGGMTWEPRPLPGAVVAVHFLTPDLGWATTNVAQNGGAPCGPCSIVHRTTDGGRTWVQLPGLQGHIGRIAFVDARRGWATAYDGDQAMILRSEDGSESWHVDQRIEEQFVADPLPHAIHAVDGHLWVEAGVGNFGHDRLSLYRRDFAPIARPPTIEPPNTGLGSSSRERDSGSLAIALLASGLALLCSAVCLRSVR
jgi:photosystem II stability/assembly factor-like uncharacterized protein